MFGLFGTKKASKGSIGHALDLLDNYFKRLKLDITGHIVDTCEGYGWWLTEGSAKVYIFVQDQPEGPVLRVNSPILHFPDRNKEGFFQRLLEINRDLSCCCLAVYDGVVLVTGQRPIAGLDQEELDTLLWNVSQTADLLDDQLAKEFGCKIFTQY
jgi:hypothetical protein